MRVPALVDPLSWPYVSLHAAALGLANPSARRGDLVGVLPGRPRLAIVGSRAAHRRFLRTLEPILRCAGARSWSLISGGALGIDGGAHRAALTLDVPQLAVLPCGRDRLYPRNHAPLFAELVDSTSAGLLFAHPAHTLPTRAMFASRNALIVNLADALLVVEASLRSGSRLTGTLGLAAGLPTAALVGSPGCGALIGAGARALPEPPRATDPRELERLCQAFVAWLEGLHSQQDAPPHGPAWPPALTWLEERVRAAGPGGATLDSLGDPGRAALALLEAELLGLVCEAAPGRWVPV